MYKQTRKQIIKNQWVFNVEQINSELEHAGISKIKI